MLLLMLDVPEFVYAFFGAIRIGAVPVPLNTRWTPADYEHVWQDSGARAINSLRWLLLRKNSARRTSSIAWLACCMTWNLS